MILTPINRALLGSCMTAFVVCAGWPDIAAQEQSVEGVFALPDVEPLVSGEMTLQETGPLSRELQLVYTDLSTGKQIPKFDVELTQELHILATDAGLTTLVHRHVEQAGVDGTFTAEVEFPAPGDYHIYTDAVPTGLGQQVLRFDVTIGEADTAAPPDAASAAPAEASRGPVTSSDGEYSVTLDPSQLEVGIESMMNLVVTKNGEPAADLAPYLGVAAHAVFIHAEDLAYVHAHAMGAGEPTSGAPSHDHGSDGHQPPTQQPDAHAGHGQAAEPATGHDMSNDHGDHGSTQESHPEHDTGGHGAQAGAAGSVAPEMSLHVTPPAPGTYALWIEFIGGGEVLTVPFRIEIPETQP